MKQRRAEILTIVFYLNNKKTIKASIITDNIQQEIQDLSNKLNDNTLDFVVLNNFAISKQSIICLQVKEGK